MNWGISDVVYKFEDNLYARVLKTIKIKLENYEASKVGVHLKWTEQIPSK